MADTTSTPQTGGLKPANGELIGSDVADGSWADALIDGDPKLKAVAKNIASETSGKIPAAAVGNPNGPGSATVQFDQPETTQLADGGEVEDGQGEAPHTVKLKINHKNVEMPLDEVIAAAQQHLAGTTQKQLEQIERQRADYDMKHREVQSIVDTINQAFGRAKAGDMELVRAVFNQAGVNFDELAMNHAVELMKYDAATPEQRKAMDEQRELARLRKEREAYAAQQRNQQQQERVQTYLTELGKAMPAVVKDVGLPDTDAVHGQVASVWGNAIRSGRLKEPTSVFELQQQARAAAEYVKSTRSSVLERDVRSLPREQLEALLGDRVNEIVQSRARKPRLVATRGTVRKPSGSEGKKSRYVGESEWTKTSPIRH